MYGPIHDLRMALRQLRRAPGFALTAVLTLAVGIGATTAIFTLVYDVMLRPLPFRHAGQLVEMNEVVAEFRDAYPTLPMNANNFLTWQKNSRTFEAMAVMLQYAMPLGAGDHALETQVLSTTPGLFRVLSMKPALGRSFTEQEAQEGHDRVVVLMHSTWREQFQGDPQILGRTITLNGFPYTVIGVMPESLHLPFQAGATGIGIGKSTAAIIPLSFSKERQEEVVGDFNYMGLGLLKEGVSVTQATGEINALQKTITAGLRASDRATLSAVLTPFQEKLVGSNRTPLLILLGAVVVLLLVGCVNITNLLLARATSRRQQMAVAAALGARRRELVRLAMRETVVLAIAGCTLGVLLADIFLPLMQRYMPTALNFRGPLHLDWAGAACAVALAAIATLLAGLAPAWLAARTQPAEVLHSESKLASESRSSKRVRRVLVAGEVAVSVTLVLMTGLLTLSLMRMMRVDRGFETLHSMTAQVALPRGSYKDDAARQQFIDRTLEHLRQLPGVERAGFISILPMTGDGWGDMIRVQGDTRPMFQLPGQNFRFMAPGYMETIRLPLAAGRMLGEGDRGRRYALVSERTAKTMWPGKDAVGQAFTRGGEAEHPFTVIGVVNDAHTVSLAKDDPMMVYVPYWYRTENSGAFVVSMRQDISSAEEIRRAVWSVDPSVAIPMVRSMDGIVEDSVANRRFEMDLLLIFAASALLLAGLGVYGVVTCSVVQREKEIGLRMALGARIADIYTLVMREGLAPVVAGAAVGLALSLMLARVFRSMLFEVSPYHPGIAAASIGVLLLAGAVSCLLPARRAARVEPMEALRSE